MAESPVVVSAVSDRVDDPPRPPGAIRRFWGAHPGAVDAVLVVTYALVSTFWAIIGPLASGSWTPVAPIIVPLVGGIVAAVSLLMRRRHPWRSFAVFGAVALVCLLVNVSVEPFGMALGLYALFVYRSNRSGWIGFAIAVFAGVAVFPQLNALLRGDSTAVLTSLPSSLVYVIVMLVAALIGVSVGDRRRYIGALLDRANQLARERDQQTRLATLAERARITREIHDVVAHSVSVMVSLADGAAALAAKDAGRTREAAQEIGSVGRHSLLEMRRLLGALGDDASDGSAPLHPHPGIDELDALIETFRTAGLPVVTRMQGIPPASPTLQNAVYRIVQEALTNALRYAEEPRSVLVHLDFRAQGLTIDVTDDGRGAARAESVGSGRGLVGIRERARLFGGTADAGQTAEGGWRVHVEMSEQGGPA